MTSSTIEQNPTISTRLFLYTPCILWIGNGQSKPSLPNDLLIKGQYVARFMVVYQSLTIVQSNIADAVSTIDLAAKVCPGGPPCRPVVDGQRLRPFDGTHFGPEGAVRVALHRALRTLAAAYRRDPS